jgi:hypothetical protein
MDDDSGMFLRSSQVALFKQRGWKRSNGYASTSPEMPTNASTYSEAFSVPKWFCFDKKLKLLILKQLTSIRRNGKAEPVVPKWERTFAVTWEFGVQAL